MPFTPAHTAAVLPFRKWVRSDYLIMLVIGSMVPDMEYFLFFNPASGFSHSITGILLFNLPLALILFYVWNLYIKDVLAASFVQPFRIRQHSSGLILLIVAAIAGIVTHLLWDEFTHAKGYFVQRSSFLQSELNVFSGIKVCYLLWYLCSIAGLIYIALLLRNKNLRLTARGVMLRDKVIFLAMMIAVIRISMGLSHNIPRHLIIIVIGSFIYSFAMLAFMEYLQHKKGRTTDPA